MEALLVAFWLLWILQVTEPPWLNQIVCYVRVFHICGGVPVNCCIISRILINDRIMLSGRSLIYSRKRMLRRRESSGTSASYGLPITNCLTVNTDLQEPSWKIYAANPDDTLSNAFYISRVMVLLMNLLVEQFCQN